MPIIISEINKLICSGKKYVFGDMPREWPLNGQRRIYEIKTKDFIRFCPVDKHTKEIIFNALMEEYMSRVD